MVTVWLITLFLNLKRNNVLRKQLSGRCLYNWLLPSGTFMLINVLFIEI